VHKSRNVLDHLPERQRTWAKAILQRAYRSADVATAKRRESHAPHMTCETEREAMAQWADGGTLGRRWRRPAARFQQTAEDRRGA
jgi:hypothetical protein